MQRLLEVHEPRVRAAEDRDLVVRNPERANPFRDELGFVVARAQLGLGAVGTCRVQRLLGSAELRHEPVREREHLRRGAVVLLQPITAACGKRCRHREQVLGRRTRERVDRLVVVADDAQLVAVAEPQLEEASAGAGTLTSWYSSTVNARNRSRTRSERGLVGGVELDRELEQVLEVDVARGSLALLVLPVDA